MDDPSPSFRDRSPGSDSKRRRAEAALRQSEERFRMLVESSPNAFVMVDRKGAVTLLNRQGELLFGYRREELIGQLVEVLVPHDIREKHGALRDGFLVEPVQRPMGAGRDLFAVRKDGSQVPVEIGLTPIETHDGLFVLATVTDITQRRRAEADLRHSEERFRTLAEAVPQIVWTATGEGVIDYTNRRWYEYTGLSPQSPERWDWERVVHPDDLAEARATWRQVFPAGRPSQSEHRLRRADQNYRWHLHRWWPLCDDAGRVVKWFGTATDVDDLKRAQESLEQLADELRRSNRDLEQFASMVSHDLQQPLIVISGYLKLLMREQGGRLDPKSREYLAVAHDSTQKMQEMVRGMLDYARVERGDKPLELTNLEDVLEQVLLALQEEIRRNPATFTHDPLPTVRGNRTQLEQVLRNLLGNALKFRSPDRPLTVHVSARRESEGWLISVQDNGIGMDPSHKELIFDIFHRLHPESAYPGAGLGLAICKKIVEHHGGRIWVDSQQNRGTTFFLTIPDYRTGETPFIAPP